MTLGVRAAVENESGRVFLVRHTYVKGWYMPGGGVERGEPALEALSRELVEEAGVKLTGSPQLVGVYSNHHVFRNDHVLLYRVRHGEWAETPAQSNASLKSMATRRPAPIGPGPGLKPRQRPAAPARTGRVAPPG